MGATPPIAKVTRPRLKHVQPRQRLFRRLDALRRGHVAPWIAAPAGSGKTSLLVSYVEARRIPTLWYRVDEGDRDAADLFFYMRLAVEALEGSRRADVELPALSPAADVAHFSRRFFEAVFARLPPGALVVLDDYHLAPEDSPWQTAIEKALGCVPAGMNVVIASRRPPPPALARPSVHGDIGVLETAELHLTEPETAAMAHRRMSRRAPPTRAELRRVHEQTGGWAAGVSLLLRRERPEGAPLPEAAADVQPVFDYLASAVFGDLSDDARRVLLHTACLASFSVRDAAALSGVARARDELRGLYRSGLFLERDAREEVYRVHPLFRSFLGHRAAQLLSSDELRATRARAAALLRSEGRDEEAFELLLEMGDLEQLRQIVQSRARALHAEGRGGLLERWLKVLPAELRQGSGWLSYWEATCALTSAPGRSRAGFERALELFMAEGDGAGAYLAWAGVVQAQIFEARYWRAIDGARLAAIERLCPAFPSAEVGSQVAGALVMAMVLASADRAAIEHWVGRALVLADNAADPTVRIMTTSVLVLNYALRGDRGEAAPLLAKLRESGRGAAGVLARVAAQAATCALAWLRGDAEASLAAAREGLALTARAPVPFWQTLLYVYGALAALDCGDSAFVRGVLGPMAALAEGGGSLEASSYHIVRALAALDRGDHQTCIVAIELANDRIPAGFSAGLGANFLLLARAAFAVGDRARGLEALAQVKRLEEEARDPVMPFWRLMVEASLARRDGERARALELLGAAFAIGRERQVYGAFAPDARELAELCRLALAERIEVEYVRTLIGRRRLVAEPPPLELPDWPWALRVRTLGALEISAEGEPPAAFGRSKMPPRLLVAIVALAGGGRTVSVERIVAALWPDAEGDKGMHAFEMTLARLRKVLGPRAREALRLEAGRLSLDPYLCWTDVAALEALLAAIKAPAGGAGEATGLAERLLALYRGPFSGTDEDPPPIIAGFEQRLRAKVAAALRALGRRLEHEEGAAAERALYARALEQDPRLDLV